MFVTNLFGFAQSSNAVLTVNGGVTKGGHGAIDHANSRPTKPYLAGRNCDLLGDSDRFADVALSMVRTHRRNFGRGHFHADAIQCSTECCRILLRGGHQYVWHQRQRDYSADGDWRDHELLHPTAQRFGWLVAG